MLAHGIGSMTRVDTMRAVADQPCWQALALGKVDQCRWQTLSLSKLDRGRHVPNSLHIFKPGDSSSSHLTQFVGQRSIKCPALPNHRTSGLVRMRMDAYSQSNLLFGFWLPLFCMVQVNEWPSKPFSNKRLATGTSLSPIISQKCSIKCVPKFDLSATFQFA